MTGHLLLLQRFPGALQNPSSSESGSGWAPGKAGRLVPGHHMGPAVAPGDPALQGDPALSSECENVILCPRMEHGPMWVLPLHHLTASSDFPQLPVFMPGGRRGSWGSESDITGLRSRWGR